MRGAKAHRLHTFEPNLFSLAAATWLRSFRALLRWCFSSYLALIAPLRAL